MTAGDSGGDVPPWQDLRDSPPPDPPEPTTPALAGQTFAARAMAGRAMAGRALAGRALAGRALAGRLALSGQRPEPGLAQLEPGLTQLGSGSAQRPEPGQAQLGSGSAQRPQSGLAQLEPGPAQLGSGPAQLGSGPAQRPQSGPAGRQELGPAPTAPAGLHTAPRRRRGWLVPFTSGALTVVVLAAVVVGSVAVLHHRHAPKKPALAKSPAAQAVPLPALMPSSALFQALTQDIQAGNEGAFLSQVAPAARPAVQTWWENLQAIGFTSGAIMPATSDDLVHVNSQGDGTITVLAGTHSSLDPVGSTGLPDIPSERYQLGLHFASASATGQITSWQPLGDDPWDQGSQLDVRKAADVVVAGPAGDSAVVNQTLPIAEAAASYDIGLLDHVDPGVLHQAGFVVFVSGSSAVRDSWFRTSWLPQSWPPESGGAVTVPLPGATGDSAATGGIATGVTGGARVVITPYGDDGGTAHSETLQLVSQFMTDVLAADDEASATSVPSWAIQGFGLAVQALYQQNTNPAPGAYNFKALTSLLHGLPSSYRSGQLPTSQQLFIGRAPAEQDFGAVAASVYAYIGTKYGLGQMLTAAALLYARDDTPFGNVQAPATKRSHGFYPPATVEAGWHAWLAHS